MRFVNNLKSKLFYLATLGGLFLIVGYVGAVTLKNPLEVDTIPQLLERIVLAVAGIIATIATIMIAWSGILFITSTGNEQRMNNAKKAFFYAIIGFVVAIAASTIIAVVKGIIQTK